MDRWLGPHPSHPGHSRLPRLLRHAFVPSGKQSTEEALFEWIVSDFGLNDAIESGLVKTPRVVVRDDGRLAADYKSRLYHIYNDPDVKDDLNRKAEEQEPLPDLVTQWLLPAGQGLAGDGEEVGKGGSQTPPVMITVANRTETAARVKYAFDRGKIRIDELRIPSGRCTSTRRCWKRRNRESRPRSSTAKTTKMAKRNRKPRCGN